MTGATLLLRNLFAAATNKQVTTCIVSSADRTVKPYRAGETINGGVLNVLAAYNCLAGGSVNPNPPPATQLDCKSAQQVAVPACVNQAAGGCRLGRRTWRLSEGTVSYHLTCVHGSLLSSLPLGSVTHCALLCQMLLLPFPGAAELLACLTRQLSTFIAAHTHALCALLHASIRYREPRMQSLCKCVLPTCGQQHLPVPLQATRHRVQHSHPGSMHRNICRLPHPTAYCQGVR